MMLPPYLSELLKDEQPLFNDKEYFNLNSNGNSIYRKCCNLNAAQAEATMNSLKSSADELRKDD